MNYLIAIVLSVVLTACMHPLVQDRRNTQGANPEPVLQKEVMIGDLKAVVTFPPMEYGKEVVFTLQLSDRITSRPVSGAKAFAQVNHMHQPEAGSGAVDSSYHHPAESEHEINWSQEMEETREPGVYAFSYKCYQTGEHNIVVRVTANRGQNLDPPIIIEVKRTINAAPDHDGGGMMGMTQTTTVVIVGAAIMSAMMIAILVAGSRMF